ncbi:hypothetical protein [Plantactinospora sp. KLBMP9567]|uniref:hypothetical protein n=1 Tax=Plantactinospora sp. KLBMP9567 TaxID=3085900 RepID=UPI00298157A6|nr:hypothetical protein [Plantactinospora sp. KLBMP9567]MDW5327506.1 hypothetical protein [Plantactinospora sp. KLBMP9567]
MIEWLAVDIHHVERSAAAISDYGRQLAELITRLDADVAAGPGWDDENGGATSTAAFAEITRLAMSKYRVLVNDLDDVGANLRRIAVEWEGSDERAASTVGKIGRGL